VIRAGSVMSVERSRRRVPLGTILGLACLAGGVSSASALQPAAPSPPVMARGTVQAIFSPWEDIEGSVVGVIHSARVQILVQSFTFTSRAIAAALLTARRKGIDVRITADREQMQVTEANRLTELASGGVQVLLESAYAAAHNKVMIIDPQSPESVVITGSYNWTWAAQRRNAENVLILRRNPDMARAYAANWHRHASQATPLSTGRAP
jgi:phosphatidylserine/phosphatidylglycerophosphate/cardiolipin synthase-like enzyme